MESSPLSTPKRKHSQLLHDSIPSLNTTKFSFDLSNNANEDGNGSPRTKVAHKFRGLALEGGGGVEGNSLSDASLETGFDAMETDLTVRKRMKFPEEPDAHLLRESDTAAAAAPVGTGQEQLAAVVGPQGEWATGLQAVVDPAIVRTAKATNRLQKSYPSINRLLESKSRRKRTGTPPLVASRAKAGLEQEGDPETEIIEPIRASLTWHEDEITVYDPDDEDDDGTGINGIGFRPTPAVAYARRIKRRQQLAEYKKREEREARAKRSQRRRGSPDLLAMEGRRSASRRVHFMETEPSPIATT